MAIKVRLNFTFKLIFYIIIVAILALGAVWVANTPGTMVAHWRDYEITITTANFIFATLFVIACFAIFIPLILGIFAAPFKWLKKKQDAKYQKGLILITEALAVIASGDVAQADILIKKTKKLLPNQPIVPILQAQLAGVKKDQVLLQSAFQSMLEYPETKALGSKSLAEFHMRKGDVIPAIPHAEQALGLEPKNTQSIKTTLSLYMRSGQLVRARELVEQSRKRRSFTKLETKELLSCLTYLQAEQAEKTKDMDAAKSLIEEAYKQSPSKPNVYTKYIDLHNNDQDINKAIQALKRSWANSYTELLPALADDLLMDRHQKKKLFKKLLGFSAQGRQHLYRMLANIAMNEQDEFEAFQWLEQLAILTLGGVKLPPKPDKHRQISSVSEIKEILDRLNKLYVQKPWECAECGANHDVWQPICRDCNTINSLTKR